MANLDTLTDDFTGALDNTKWASYTSNGGTLTSTGTGLILATSSTSNSSAAQITSVAGFGLIGSYVFARIDPFTPADVNTVLHVFSTASGTRYMSLRYYNGNMQGRVNTTTWTTLEPYSAALWKYWRIGFTSAGYQTFERSADGVNWVVVAGATYSLSTSFNTVKAQIYTQNTGNAANGQTLVDSVNIAAPTGPLPNSVNDVEAVDNPTALWTNSATPSSASDTETLDPPLVSQTPIPTSINDVVSIGTPDVSFAPNTVSPDSIIDLGPVGTPSVDLVRFYTGAYGEGAYGEGTYSGAFISPASIVHTEAFGAPTLIQLTGPNPASLNDPETLGSPTIGGTAVPPDKMPLTIIDPETVDSPAVSFLASGGYGQGLYGAGLYGQGQLGETVTLPDTPTGATNYAYGAGTYGEGIYYGSTVVVAPPPVTDTPPATDPLFGDVAGITKPALHILGVGPWSPRIVWRGAANYGVPGGNRPARPAMPLPAATSKGFTLRVNEASEARVELNLSRGSGLIIDEIDTDLWWRRKDPRTGVVEMIGRFNTSHANTSASDSGINVSLQFDDYRTLLGQRLVMRYLHPDWPDGDQSQWAKGTKVTDVLAWALPKDMRLDLTEVTGETPYNLGVLNGPYHLPPGTSIEDVMDGLNALSPIRWEWWIETPNNINEAPKLRFTLGQRGTDKGVVLFDLGKGPSPILGWTRNAAADNYANALFYSGGEGSVVQTIPAQIAQYGQRDATAGNSSIPGTEIQLLKSRAQKKLASLASRAPTYSVQLARSFWRGRAHIDVGDTVTLIIRLGKETLREQHRVTEISVDIDVNGFEDVTLTLGTPLPSPDSRSKRAPLQKLVRTLRSYNAPRGSDKVITEDE